MLSVYFVYDLYTNLVAKKEDAMLRKHTFFKNRIVLLTQESLARPTTVGDLSAFLAIPKPYVSS